MRLLNRTSRRLYNWGTRVTHHIAKNFMVPVIRISLGGWISGYALHQTDLKASLVVVGVREVRMRL